MTGGGGGGVATITFGKERFDDREVCLNDGGDVDITLFDGLRDRERVVCSLSSDGPRPFSLSVDPPTVRREIIRCKRPDFVLDDDSNEMTLALTLGEDERRGSSGGPSSRNAISSRAAREMCGVPGFFEDVGDSVDELDERVVVVFEVRMGGSSFSSSSEPPMISSKSSDSRCLPIRLVFCGWPGKSLNEPL